MRYLVTGTNRGIGLELTRQLLARGDTVIGTLRAEPPGELNKLAGERLRLVRCDVTEPESLGALAEALDGVALDVVINNAGVIGGMTSLERVDLADARRTFEVNALGPLADDDDERARGRRGLCGRRRTTGDGTTRDGGANEESRRYPLRDKASRSELAEAAVVGAAQRQLSRVLQSETDPQTKATAESALAQLRALIGLRSAA